MNPYLSGNFAPVRDELTAEDLPVEGTLPPGLEGVLLRNGPNPIAPDPDTHHWFTGDGMLHGIHLSGGRARWYRNRWVRTVRALAALGEPPRDDHVEDTPLGPENAANTHVVHHAGRILALVEVCLPTEVRADLGTIGLYDFGGALRTPMTAHPKRDPSSGELHFFGYDVFGPPFVRYHVADAAGALVKTEPITVPSATMMHDFALTATRVVFLDLPVVFDLDLVGQRGMPFRWDPAYGARVGVMPRDGGDADVRWCETEDCYVFHVMNAFDDGPAVVLDVCRYDHMYKDDVIGVTGADPFLERWRADPATGTVARQRVMDAPVEFPRVDPRTAGGRHRFGYLTAAGARQHVSFGGLRKVDLDSGAVEEHDVGPGCSAGEGVFVPASDGSGEDEGYVLSVVYDAARDASDLLVLDAQHLSSRPLATVRLPRRVPFGFHGSWLPAGETTGL